MNDQRRKEIERVRAIIEKAFNTLEEARGDLGTLISEEQEYFDNMPESLQSGEKGEKAQAAVELLQYTHDDIDGFDFDTLFNNLSQAAE